MRSDAADGASIDGVAKMRSNVPDGSSIDGVAYRDLKRVFDRAVRLGDLVAMRHCFDTCPRVAREEDRRSGEIPLVVAVQPDALSIADNVNVLQVS